MDKKSNFVEIKKSNKIWAIGSIHSNLKSFTSIKKFLLNNFEENDKLIFLGNVIGLGNNSKETLSSVIDLRFNLMSKFKLKPESIVFLRGAQEYDAKIFSGDPIKIAEVVRDLFRKNSQSEQSYSERQMFQVAIERLAREVAAVEKTDYFQSTEKIEQILNKK